MQIAHDKDDNRVYIDDTCSNQGYYCPCCGAPLITQKGDIRQHHFAHKNGVCKDSWGKERDSSELSDWHNNWQTFFPINNREIILELGNTKHRADIIVYKTVVEFQHSVLSEKSFDDRNNFYSNLDYKVVWLFDVIDLIENQQIVLKEGTDTISGEWKKYSWGARRDSPACRELHFVHELACAMK